MEKMVLYFDKPGKDNTGETLAISRARAGQLGIRQVVVASSHGYTANCAKEVFAGLDVNIIAVTINASFTKEGWVMSDAERIMLEKQGIRVLTSTHTLGDDVNAAFGAASPNIIVRQALYTFCQGMKVAVEISLRAADAGLLDMSQELIAIAGTDEGADTAIVLKPTYSRNFTQLRIREILAKPR